MRALNSFRFYFFGAIGVHAFLALLFSFSFSLPAVPAKTGFVFLGSFLSPQDVGLFVSQHSAEDSKRAVNKLKLDSKNISGFRELNKPLLSDKILIQQKHQFKPVTVQSIEPVQASRPSANEDDSEFEIGPPVRLRIGNDD